MGKIAVTIPEFQCSAEVSLRSAFTNAGGNPSFEVEAVSIAIDLHTTITEPFDCTQKIKDHEEGHRMIAEYFYSNGRKAAEYAGRALYHRVFAALKPGQEDSEAAARRMAVRAVKQEYLKYTDIPYRSAAVYYDQLTDSGRDPTNTSMVVSQTIEQFKFKLPPEPVESAAPTSRQK